MGTRTRFKQVLQKSVKIGHSSARSSSQLHLGAINCKLQAISNQLVIRYLLYRKGSGVMPGHKPQRTQQLLCTCEKGVLGQLEAGILCETHEAIFLLCSALIKPPLNALPCADAALEKETEQTMGGQCTVMDATKTRTTQNKLGECPCRGANLEHK